MGLDWTRGASLRPGGWCGCFRVWLKAGSPPACACLHRQPNRRRHFRCVSAHSRSRSAISTRIISEANKGLASGPECLRLLLLFLFSFSFFPLKKRNPIRFDAVVRFLALPSLDFVKKAAPPHSDCCLLVLCVVLCVWDVPAGAIKARPDTYVFSTPLITPSHSNHPSKQKKTELHASSFPPINPPKAHPFKATPGAAATRRRRRAPARRCPARGPCPSPRS